MIPIPANEDSRLESLHSLGIFDLDSATELMLDTITLYIAKKLLNVPIIIISFIDTDRQYFKSAYGCDTKDIPREISICAHAIYHINSTKPTKRIYEIENLQKDKRFSNNPQVSGNPGIRSYLSYVIQSPTGENIGTLCFVGYEPRKHTLFEKMVIVETGVLIEKIVCRRTINYQRITH